MVGLAGPPKETKNVFLSLDLWEHKDFIWLQFLEKCLWKPPTHWSKPQGMWPMSNPLVYSDGLSFPSFCFELFYTYGIETLWNWGGDWKLIQRDWGIESSLGPVHRGSGQLAEECSTSHMAPWFFYNFLLLLCVLMCAGAHSHICLYTWMCVCMWSPLFCLFWNSLSWPGPSSVG